MYLHHLRVLPPKHLGITKRKITKRERGITKRNYSIPSNRSAIWCPGKSRPPPGSPSQEYVISTEQRESILEQLESTLQSIWLVCFKTVKVMKDQERMRVSVLCSCSNRIPKLTNKLAYKQQTCISRSPSGREVWDQVASRLGVWWEPLSGS